MSHIEICQNLTSPVCFGGLPGGAGPGAGLPGGPPGYPGGPAELAFSIPVRRARRNGPAARRTVRPTVRSRRTWRRTSLPYYLSIVHLSLPDFEFLFVTCIFIWCCFALLAFSDSFTTEDSDYRIETAEELRAFEAKKRKID